MIDKLEHSKCTGCAACMNICPTNAIKMVGDREGFLQPHIDQDKCTKCNLCEKICPILNQSTGKNEIRKGVAAYYKDEKIRIGSSSGGIFACLAQYVLEKDGVVFGARFDREYNVVHDYTESIEGLAPFMGSKYLQSQIGMNFLKVREFLNEGRLVLFTGTSCQIGGLNAFLRKDYKNLITIDLICLGVPSARIWQLYLENYFHKDNIKKINFKDKEKGWNNFSIHISEMGRDFRMKGRTNIYMKGFFKNLYNRRSCAVCPYKTRNRVSDLTLADCWGYQYNAIELFDNKGLSSIIIHSEKGESLFDRVKGQLEYMYIDAERLISHNKNMVETHDINEKREEFFEEIEKNNFKKVMNKYCREGFFVYMKRKLGRYVFR